MTVSRVQVDAEAFRNLPSGEVCGSAVATSVRGDLQEIRRFSWTLDLRGCAAFRALDERGSPVDRTDPVYRDLRRAAVHASMGCLRTAKAS